MNATETRSCPDCDPEVRGIRGRCLEHRAQIAEQLARALQGIMDRPMSALAIHNAHAALAKVQP